jgi:hypothetical protein
VIGRIVSNVAPPRGPGLRHVPIPKSARFFKITGLDFPFQDRTSEAPIGFPQLPMPFSRVAPVRQNPDRMGITCIEIRPWPASAIDVGAVEAPTIRRS